MKNLNSGIAWYLAGCFTLIAASSTQAAADGAGRLSEAELAEGWIQLFDGESLYGWTATSQADWEVVDGAISVSSGQPGFLRTTTQWADYVLKVDFRAPAATNSGVFLRMGPQVQDPASDCYELNIAGPDHPYPTGSLVTRKKAATVGQRDGWRTFEVTAAGGDVRVTLDGAPVLSYRDPAPLQRGFIGLQLNTGEVQFRNIRLRPLGHESLFNGKDLSGWRTDQLQQSVVSVTPDGAMQIKNGKGQVESVGTYDDFVLQLEIFVRGKELNSGIFFRSIPGDIWMGYESQIHNGFDDGDRNRPNNGGTGGIFRRQNARRVVANDFEWFHKTIVADGPHMAVWVNGIQVSDFTDSRPPDENPRKGLRLKAGSLIIQGHDPSTDLSFRNIRIAKTAGR